MASFLGGLITSISTFHLSSTQSVFIICFSLVEPVSFRNVQYMWYNHVRDKCPRTPIILVGTKLDLRESGEVRRELAEKVNCNAINRLPTILCPFTFAVLVSQPRLPSFSCLSQSAASCLFTTSQGQKPVEYAEGLQVAKSLGARYMECSAVNQVGLKDVFDESIRKGMQYEEELSQGFASKKGCCTIS